jgi:hypothetical protein
MRRSCIVPLVLSSLAISDALAQTPVIDHQEVACVVAEKFPLFSARLDPAESIARVRVHFRAEGGPVWYYVEMKNREGVFYGTLPKPRKSTKKIHYYIEVVDKSLAESRTQEYSPDVVSGADACSRKMAVASVSGATSVVVGAPAGAPLPPLGFAPSGIVAAGTASAAGSAAVAGAAAGVSTAVIVAGVVGAGAAAAGIAVAAGKQGGSTTTTVPTTTTTLPPQINLTGSWAGTAPDGLITTANLECDAEHDLFLDLTHTGTSLGGTWRVVLRKLNPNASRRFRCTDPVGTVMGPFPIQGTASSGTVSFTVTVASSPTQATASFTGTFTATRMNGTWACVGGSCPQSGTWAVNR